MGTWRWPLLNLLGLVATVAINALANILRFNGQTTGDVINRDPTLFLPANWVFGIWGLIYAALVLFVSYGFLPGGRHNERLQRLGPLFLISCVANCAWLFFWHWELLILALATIVALLLSLFLIYLRLHRGGLARTVGERLCLRWPFSIYLAWISMATIANAVIALDRAGWQGGGLSPAAWTALLLVIGGLLAVFVGLRGDAPFAAVFVWAFVGIAVRQRDTLSVVLVAWIIAAIAALVVLYTLWRWARHPFTPGGRFSRQAV